MKEEKIAGSQNGISYKFFENNRPKGHGQGPGKCWSFKILKGYESCVRYYKFLSRFRKYLL